ESPSARGVWCQERTVGPRPAGEQAVERARDRTEEGGRHPDRGGDPDAIAVARNVLDRDPALVTCDSSPDRSAGGRQLGQPCASDGGSALGPGGDLVGTQVAE